MPMSHLITLGAIAAATALVCNVIDRRMSRIENVTWRVAVIDHEILAAVQRDTGQRDAAKLN